MKSEVGADRQVVYQLVLDNTEIDLNALVGKQVKLSFTGIIHCISCGKVTRKSFAQGFCFSCMQSAPEAEACVLRPALCKAHLGLARAMDYAREHCLKSHFVYLANTGEVKVGVTRQSQLPTRWIDQGASAAIKLCETPNRHIAGLVEQHLSQHFSDKTLWKKMVMNQVNKGIDLLDVRQKALEYLTPGMLRFKCSDDQIYTFNYPVTEYPDMPQTLSLDKVPVIEGVLKGIKGQYLLLDKSRVLNIRRHSGYQVILDY
ncbi:MAG: DUF2797 domain-containing protein [Bacteroidales bacterium]|nr:DUF2797 domain-containing protein [Bacteroidales bacterium]